MKQITIYHNPNCGTSRNVLNIIRATGIEPNIIEYLKTPPTEKELKKLLSQMNICAKDLLRTNVAEFEKHDLGKNKSEQDIINAMMIDPILINRPVVVTEKGTLLCRPSEKVLKILTKPLKKDFVKEDGEIISSNI